MNEAERDTELLRVIREHSENEKHIACLESRLERIGVALTTMSLEHRGTITAARASVGDANVADDLAAMDRALANRERCRTFLFHHGISL